MARRRHKSGSGVLAGVIAAAIGFVFFAHYMSTSHTISGVIPDAVTNDQLADLPFPTLPDWWATT